MRIQIERLVNFHKALADVTRLRIIALLKSGPLCGQEIAERLGVSAPTVTHHMKVLRDVGLVSNQRDKNTIYFHLLEKDLQRGLKGVLEMTEEAHIEMAEQEKKEKEEQGVLKNFFNADGSLKSIPSQRKKKIIVLRQLLKDFQMGVAYPENEINEAIKKYHEDFCTIRREFIINHFMHRQNGLYTLNPPQMWAQP